MENYLSFFNLVKTKMDILGGNYPTFDVQLYERTFNIFVLDYKRWYPNDTTINVKRAILTPQLLAVLMYRLAHECFILPDNHCLKNDADIYAFVGRDMGQIEIFYSSTIGKGLRINHGVGSVIGARGVS